ncbi:TIGR00297 family protein [Candidatus Cyanaurora vandensis]|uniref:TIGR00297 family protein n=1 Tax=Candidatus Cyanaurora vandensis TaxID=2714958 RepID=UPI0025803F83|nr:TIGR00297 family protein [Candidatus Cyanaurora vandensis]
MNPWLWAVGVNTLLAGLAYFSRVKLLTPLGILHSWALGVLVWGGLGEQGYAVIFFYFVVGSLVTRVGFARKAAQGIAEARDGARGPANVWGSAAVAAVCTLGYILNPHPLWLMGYVSSLATKLSDTTASEIGKAYGQTTYLITTLRPVPAGTEGAVSLEGTLAGVGAGLVLAALGAGLALVPWSAIPFVVLAATLATTAESLIGATLQQAGYLSNEAVNVLNTALGALLGAGLFWLLG